MSGWCVANLFDLTARERLFCMLAASLSDLDGLGILFGQEYYWKWHHIAGHNLFFGIILSLIMTVFSKNKLKMLLLTFGLFHLHLLLDYLGSGELWTIHYLWPVSDLELMCPFAWALYSWQNILTGFALLIWIIFIAAHKNRTPIELMMPSLDQKLVDFARKILRMS